jgi:hypothetical protein
MKKLFFTILLTYLFFGCAVSHQIEKKINNTFFEEYNFKKKSDDSKFRKIFFDYFFDKKIEQGEYILIQKLDIPEISGSTGSIISIKNPNGKISYYSIDDSGFIEKLKLFDHSFHKKQSDYIYSKLQEKEYQLLTELHKEENREISHSSNVYIAQFTVNKNSSIIVEKVLFFEEFGVLD